MDTSDSERGGDVDASSTQEGGSQSLEDCVICLSNLKYVPQEINHYGEAADGNLEVKECKGYMETPCMHRFHKKCLKQWM